LSKRLSELNGEKNELKKLFVEFSENDHIDENMILKEKLMSSSSSNNNNLSMIVMMISMLRMMSKDVVKEMDDKDDTDQTSETEAESSETEEKEKKNKEERKDMVNAKRRMNIDERIRMRGLGEEGGTNAVDLMNRLEKTNLNIERYTQQLNQINQLAQEQSYKEIQQKNNFVSFFSNTSHTLGSDGNMSYDPNRYDNQTINTTDDECSSRTLEHNPILPLPFPAQECFTEKGYVTTSLGNGNGRESENIENEINELKFPLIFPNLLLEGNTFEMGDGSYLPPFSVFPHLTNEEKVENGEEKKRFNEQFNEKGKGNE
jgi:hypothetical protein